MRTFILPVALGLGLLLGGCEETGVPIDDETTAGGPTGTQTPGGTQPTATQQQDLPKKAQQALAIERQVKQNPQQLDAALQQEGMTRDDFDKLMYDVAEDPKLTDAYLAQREAPAGMRRQ